MTQQQSDALREEVRDELAAAYRERFPEGVDPGPSWRVYEGFLEGAVDVDHAAFRDDTYRECGWVMTNRYKLAAGDDRVDAMACALLQIDDFIRGWENFDARDFPQHPENWYELWEPLRVTVKGPEPAGCDTLSVIVIVRAVGVTALRGDNPQHQEAYRRFVELKTGLEILRERAREEGRRGPVNPPWGSTRAFVSGVEARGAA